MNQHTNPDFLSDDDLNEMTDDILLDDEGNSPDPDVKPAAAENQDDVPPLPDDWEAKYQASEKARIKAEKERSAAVGQISPAQAENARLKRELDEARRNNEPQAKDVATPKWDQFKEDFEEDAAPHEERFEKTDAQLEELRSRLDEVANISAKTVEELENDRIQDELDNLLEIHPDFNEILAGEDYGPWLAEQPSEIQAMAESTDARTYDKLITMFKTDNSKTSTPGDEGDDTPASAADDEAQAKARKLKEQRARAMRSTSPTSGSKGGGGSSARSSGTELVPPDGLTEEEAADWLIDNDDTFADWNK